MKKFFIVCAFLSAISINTNAQALSGLLKSLTSDNKTETQSETANETTTQSTTSAGDNTLGGLLGSLAGSISTNINDDDTVLSSDGVVSGLLGSILNSFTTVNQQVLIGTWNFKGSAFVFESENALASLGSDAVASQLETKVDQYLSKFNIKENTCTITFNEDNTCIFTAGKRSLNGTYEYNTETKELALNFGALIKTTAYLVYDAGTINLVYQSDGLLRILKAIGSMSSNSTLALLNTLLDQYNGLRIGMAFTM